MKDLLTALQSRRSIYAIDCTSPISQEEICTLVKQAALHAPSSFHMQSARVAVLFGEHHARLWEIACETLAQLLDPAQFGPAEKKIASFAAGYGTLLFFEETDTVAAMSEKHELYRDQFPVWAQQANGMLQFAVWSLLEAQGLGASLQHYNPLIDEAVRAQWGFPLSWQLIAQMPFGSPTAAPGAKKALDVNDRVRVFR